jgi:uncharacterized membrane protein (UPF0127 family)
MKDKFIIIAVIVIIVLILALGVYMSLDNPKDEEVDIQDVTLDEILSEEGLVSAQLGGTGIMLELALTSKKKVRGLSEREFLAENQGMLFIFAQPALQAFWMKGMKFPIDFIWLREGVVVGVTENVPPPVAGISENEFEIYRPEVPANMVLEVNAGWAARNNIQVGDRLEIFQ